MRMKLEAVLECLLNGEQGEASKMLHEYIVDRSRSIYGEMADGSDEEVMEVSDQFADDDASMYEVDDEFGDEPIELGGDESADFISDVEADPDAEEGFGDEFGGEGEEADTETRLSELESDLAALMAEFEQLMGDDVDADADFETDDAGEGNPFGADDEEETEEVKEATNFSNKVSVDMSKEGQEAGNGKSQSVDTTSTFAKKPAGITNQGKPIKTDASVENGGGTISYSKEKVAHANTKTSSVAAPSNTEKSGGSKSIIGESRKPAAKKFK